MHYQLIPRFNYDFNFLKFLKGIYALIFIGKPSIQRFQDYLNTKNTFFSQQARTGIKLFLDALSNEKDLYRVGVQAYTCETVFKAIKLANCVPVFIDISDNYIIDLNDLSRKANEIDCLIITHTFGIPAPIKEIRELINGKPILEDCAHAMFSFYKEKPVGSYGDASVFSFGYGKYPSIGNLSCLVINNPKFHKDVAQQYSQLRNPSFLKSVVYLISNFAISLAHYYPIYGILTYSFGKKLDRKTDLLSKKSFSNYLGSRSLIHVLNCDFPLYKTNIEHQRINYLFLISSLKKDFHQIDENDSQHFNGFILPLRSCDRNEIINYLIAHGFESSTHFSNAIIDAQKYDYEIGTCPNTEMIVNEVFTVPVHYKLRSKTIQRIATLLNGFN